MAVYGIAPNGTMNTVAETSPPHLFEEGQAHIGL